MSLLDRFFQLREESAETKPFLEHLEDLRWMLMKMAMVLLASMVGSFFMRHELVRIVQQPLASVDPELVARLQTLGVADSLTISFQLAFYAGFVVSFPLHLLFLAQFVIPALTKKEKKVVFPGIAIGTGLFLGGVVLCYFFVLPQTLEFFFQDAKSLDWKPTWTVREYFSFVTHMTLAFGIAFELPIVVMTLVGMGMLSFEFLNRTRPYAVVVLMVIAAILAPTPDLITFFSMAAPMCLMYEACIWLAWMIDRRRKRRLEAPLDPL
ncbi:MAG TPA: twin-arginine translocase subunit TatC [Chthoniobacteraceae bacterium]|nr:twin-arginine translocase subunit TatC [Chthoniobacteraceae bacterium]